MEYLEENNIEYYVSDSSNMGTLRNIALPHITTEWWLYFSSDDELLPHACKEIVNTNADAVSLLFDMYEIDNSIKLECHSPCINNVTTLQNWDRAWGGYVAVKGNTDIRFNEDIEVPNLTLHFELFRRGLNTVESKTICAIHHRWLGSHHFRSNEADRLRFVEEINRIKDKIIEELLSNATHVTIKANHNYNDSWLLKELKNNTIVIRNGESIYVPSGKILKNDMYMVTKERGIELSKVYYKAGPQAKPTSLITIVDIINNNM